VGADFGALFDQADVDLGVDLLEADRGGRPAGPPPTTTTSNSMDFALHADLDRLD
jgi:hypothetical protein